MQLSALPRLGTRAFFISLLACTTVVTAAHFLLPSSNGVALLPQALIATFVMHFGLANLTRMRSGVVFALAGAALALACGALDYRVGASTPFDVLAAFLIGSSATVGLLSTHAPTPPTITAQRDQEPQQAV